MSFLIDGNGNEQRTNCPPGVYNAVCDEVFDLGMQPGYQDGPPKRKAVLLFEVERRMVEGKFKGQRHQLSKILAVSSHEKAVLSGLLRSWVGYDPAREPHRKFDLEGLKGKPCTLNVVEETRNGKTRAIVASVAPKMASAETLTPESDGRVPEFVRRMQDERLDKPDGGTGTFPEGSEEQ